jgi:hypothetical protein
MGAKPGNKNAAKTADKRRNGRAIYLRPTVAEREEIDAWTEGKPLSKTCLEAVLAKAREHNEAR